MSWVLFLAAFALGFGACGIFVWFAQSRNLPGPGQHTGPMLLADEKPSHPRFGELIETPAEGIEAVRPDGVIRVGAHERNVRPRRTADHAPWSASLPVLDGQAEAEQARVDWVRSQLEECRAKATTEDMRRVLNSLRAMPVHGFGVDRCEADVLAAEQAERLIA